LQPGKISLQEQTWRGHGTSGSSQKSLDQVARFWKLPRDLSQSYGDGSIAAKRRRGCLTPPPAPVRAESAARSPPAPPPATYFRDHHEVMYKLRIELNISRAKIGMSLFKKFDPLLGRASAIFTFVSPILPGTIGALVTGWLAMGVEQINQYGWFGWWCAAFGGFFVVTLLYLLIGYARNLMVQADAMRKWAREVDRIDPMAKVFENKRIRVSDLAHPITGKIKGKTFRESEILGPENIFFVNCIIHSNNFTQCEFVIVRDDSELQVFNLKVFENCIIQNSEIGKCTVFLNQATFDSFKASAPWVPPITYEKP
jgi:hypothetical protein